MFIKGVRAVGVRCVLGEEKDLVETCQKLNNGS